MKRSAKFITAITIGALIAIAPLVAACGGPYALTEQERTTAEAGARDVADRSDAAYTGCSGQDSDRDGYVTCSMKDRKAPHESHELACAYKARGCKGK